MIIPAAAALAAAAWVAYISIGDRAALRRGYRHSSRTPDNTTD